MNNDFNLCKNIIIADSAVLTANPDLIDKSMTEHLKGILSKKSFPIDTQDSDGLTLRMIAANQSRKSYLQVLLDYEPNLSLKDSQGYTALDFACDKDEPAFCIETVKILLDAGAKPTQHTINIIKKLAKISNVKRDKLLKLFNKYLYKTSLSRR